MTEQLSLDLSPLQLAKFWSRVYRSASCWEWTGHRMPEGYGQVRFRVGLSDLSLLAHRVAFELINGPIPLGYEVCHHCDNPPCVNPAHLFVGTHAENMADMGQKGRMRRVYTSRLSAEQLLEIRRRAQAGEKQRSIAQDFGISSQYVSQLVSGKRRPKRQVPA